MLWFHFYCNGVVTIEGRRTFGFVFPILKGGNSAFIAAIASGLFP